MLLMMMKNFLPYADSIQLGFEPNKERVSLAVRCLTHEIEKKSVWEGGQAEGTKVAYFFIYCCICCNSVVA